MLKKAKVIKLPKVIRRAVKCGHVPPIRPIQDMIDDPQTTGEMVVSFAATHLVVPEGMKRGEPLVLDIFQVVFIISLFDNPHGTRHAYLSIARRNGKTFLVAVILLAFIIGPLAIHNSTIASAAMSRDQAAICFSLMFKILLSSPDVAKLYKAIPSKKQIIGLKRNVEYTALASDAKTGFGKSLLVLLLDEAGQIKGPNNDFVDMLTTSQGSYDDSLMITISTQSPSDVDFLSVMLDQAEVSQDPHTISHVYEAKEGCDLMDEKQWYASNPGLGKFRSLKDLKEQLKTAVAIPAKEAGARNLLLNQRIAQVALFLSPNVWKRNNKKPDLEVFKDNYVVAGLDLSKRNDLTACVIAAKDKDGFVHTVPFVFCPTHGIEERSKRDRAPYAAWVVQNYLIPLGGETMDYEQIATYLRDTLADLNITVDEVHFDRWNIDNFQAACEEAKAFSTAEFVEVGQGFKDFGPRTECALNHMLDGKIKHGGHPLLTMSASNAIAVSDPAGAIKLDKSKSTQRIDPLVAMVMAIYPLLDGGTKQPVDVEHWIA